MIHSQTLTTDELGSFLGFFIFKDDGIHQVNDLIVVTQKIMSIDAEQKEHEQISRKQIFFTITDVKTAKEFKGVKRGYAMVKVKRTKNPIPKESADVVTEVDADAAPVADDEQ